MAHGNLQGRDVTRSHDVGLLEYVGLLGQPVVIPPDRVLELLVGAHAAIERIPEIVGLYVVASLDHGSLARCQIDAIDRLLRGEVLDLVHTAVMCSRHPDNRVHDDVDGMRRSIACELVL
jgi:hypothetical protein